MPCCVDRRIHATERAALQVALARRLLPARAVGRTPNWKSGAAVVALTQHRITTNERHLGAGVMGGPTLGRMGTVRTSAVCLGIAYLVAVASLGPLLGSTADSSTAFVDHFASDANVRTDLIASLLLAAASTLLVWTIVLIRDRLQSEHEMRRLCDVLGALSVISASGLLVAAGLLATVPLTTSIGNITDDPGIEPPVQAGIAQAGTVVLLMSMLVVGATFVLAARLGRAAGAIPRWVAVTSWIVAAALVLGMSIALLFPFGAWLIALGLTWRTEEPVP